MIGVEWVDMYWSKLHTNIFICSYCLFKLNFVETSLIFNEGDLKVIQNNKKTPHEEISANQGFKEQSFELSEVGVNGSVILLEKGEFGAP